MGDWWLMQVWKAADSHSHNDRVQAKVAEHDGDQHEDDGLDDYKDNDPKRKMILKMATKLISIDSTYSGG